MKNILTTILALVATVSVIWGVDTYNKAQFASMKSVEQLAESVDKYITSQNLESVLDKLWELQHSGRAITEADEKEIERLEIERTLLLEKLKGLSK